MKKEISIILLLISISIGISAQRFKGGALLGINASQVDGDHWAGYYKMGLLLGAFVNTDFRNKFGGQLEIKFSGKGSSTQPDSPVIEKIKLNYIDVPVLATYQAIENMKVEAGISINYLYKAEYYDGGWMDTWDYEPNKFESALVFGINYSFFKNFDINVRYSYSLLPVRSKYSSSDWGEGAWFNNVVSFAMYFHK